MNSIEKLALVLGAAAPPQTECSKINDKYNKKIRNADKCKTEGKEAADRITWINNRIPEDGMTGFTWTWEGCNPQGDPVEVFPFFPEGDKHRLTGGSTSNPDQDGGSMRPPRGRGALLTPALFTPSPIDPSMDPPSNRDRLDARRNEEKCKISLRHNEILYSLAVEKETELYNANCGSYAANIPDRKKKFDKKKEDIKKDFQEKQSNIRARKPCKKS
jgi:hypothetical protein